MKRSIRAVTTGSSTEPSSSTASWNARMLNFAPSVFSAFRGRARSRARPYNLSKGRWSLGWVSVVDSEGRRTWIVDAHRGDGRRFVVRLSGKLTALESAIRTRQPLTASPGLMPLPVLFHPHIEVCKLLRKLLSKRFVFDPSGGRIQRFL